MKFFQILLPLALLLPNLWGQASFTSGGAIVVSNTIKASPYPTSGTCMSNNACVDVTGLTGTIQNVSITLSNVTLTGTANVAILLESPGGGKLDILSNVCRGSGTQTFTLTDQAATSAVPGPSTNCITTGNWKPTNNHFTGFYPDNFPSPGPGTTGYTRSDPDSNGTGVLTINTGTFGNVFAASPVNATPNGTWKLWVTNQASSGVTGQIGSWTVTVTTSTPTAPSNYCAPAGASTTTYTCTVTGLTTYYSGLVIPFKPDVTNTASSTVNVTSLGAKTVQKLSSGSLGNLSSGDLVAGVVYLLRYNGTVFVVDPGSGGGTPGGADTQVQYNNAGAFGGSSLFTFNGGTGAVSASSYATTGASPGSLALYESSPGTDHVDIVAPSTLAATTQYTWPDTPPAGSNTTFTCGVPSAGISTCSFATSSSGPVATSGYGNLFTGNYGGDYSGSIGFSANVMRVLQINVPVGLTVTKAHLVIQTASAATTMYVGLYSGDCTTLLTSGSAASTSTGLLNITLSSYALTAGQYYFAFGNSSATPTIGAMGTGTNGRAGFNQGTKPFYATAANAISGGLPSSCGALTNATFDNYPYFVMDN